MPPWPLTCRTGPVWVPSYKRSGPTPSPDSAQVRAQNCLPRQAFWTSQHPGRDWARSLEGHTAASWGCPHIQAQKNWELGTASPSSATPIHTVFHPPVFPQAQELAKAPLPLPAPLYSESRSPEGSYLPGLGGTEQGPHQSFTSPTSAASLVPTQRKFPGTTNGSLEDNKLTPRRPLPAEFSQGPWQPWPGRARAGDWGREQKEEAETRWGQQGGARLSLRLLGPSPGPTPVKGGCKLLSLT